MSCIFLYPGSVGSRGDTVWKYVCVYLGFSTFFLFSFICMEGRSSISWREEVKRQGTGRVDATCDRETNEEKE